MAKLPIPFAKHTTYPGHGGIDFPQPRGATIRASGPGVVYHRNTTDRGGNQIWVRYDTGVKVGYAHMDSFTGCPKIGTRVTEGTQLGKVGSKGARSTGPHLHIEISGQAFSDAVWKYFDPNRVVGTSAGNQPTGGGTVTPPRPKEIKVKSYHFEDKTARNGGRTVKPGDGFYLHTTAGLPTSKASNVVGGVGAYSITPHVYAAGTPGDVLELKLIWQATKANPVKNSSHYIERLVVDKDGLIRASREFKRAVASGDAVYARLDAPKSNKGPIAITLLDSDAYLYTVA